MVFSRRRVNSKRFILVDLAGVEKGTFLSPPSLESNSQPCTGSARPAVGDYMYTVP